jgi:DNA-binding response OmpR family regulator
VPLIDHGKHKQIRQTEMEATRRPHVLIVSDDLELSQFLRDGLTIAGFWTSVVASALQTLELFRLRTFDLMLIDALLEGLGVDELLQRLRGIGESDKVIRTDIPIVIVAGSEDEVTGDGTVRLGADDIVYAPIEIDELALKLYATVREWRGQHPDRPWADAVAQKRHTDPQ